MSPRILRTPPSAPIGPHPIRRDCGARGVTGVTDPVAAAAALRTKAEARRDVLAALEDVIAELRTLRADPEAQRWLRRRLEGLTG